MRALTTEEDEKFLMDEVRMWAGGLTDCLWLSRIDPGHESRVAGVVRKLRVDPSANAVEATITDGTASLMARWALADASRPVLGTVPGWALILEGVPRAGPDGPFMTEPHFEIVPGPRIGTTDRP